MHRLRRNPVFLRLSFVGLGLAAIRDVISYAKYDLGSSFPMDRGAVFGFSQTGRFIRHFLYQG